MCIRIVGSDEILSPFPTGSETFGRRWLWGGPGANDVAPPSPGLKKRRLPHGQFRESPVPLATFHEACVPVVSLRSTTGSWLTFLRDGRDRVAPPLWFRLRRAVRLTSRMFARCASFR